MADEYYSNETSILDLPNIEMVINKIDISTQTDIDNMSIISNETDDDDCEIVSDHDVIIIQAPFCTAELKNPTWICDMCTYINKLEDSVCSICLTPQVTSDKSNIHTELFHERVSCQSCYEMFDGKNGMIINFCLHRFCINCLKKSISECVEFDLICPYQNGNFHCHNIVSIEQIKLFANKELIDLYIAKEKELIEKNESIRLCYDVTCDGFISCDNSILNFICDKCTKTNCFICEVIHDGKSCDQYQEYINKKHFTCPNCTLDNSLSIYECAACHERNPDYIADDAYYCEMLTLTEQPIVKNNRDFECPICFEELKAGEGIMLKACLHMVCKQCLEDCIKHSETPEVKCPYMDQNYSCTQNIADNEIREIASEETFNQFLDKSIKLAEVRAANAFHCKTPDCTWWCEYEVGVNEAKCPTCSKVNCLNCQVIHEPKTCKEYQDDVKDKLGEGSSVKLLDELIAKGEAMKCPGCGITVMKRSGCDYIECSMCKIGICWVTRGRRWGPAGLGDKSGGCRCNFNGRKCHPNCGNCH